MKGSMIDYPLTLQAILERIPKIYPTEGKLILASSANFFQ
jgi:hypothetical protein